jgi:DNA-binding winged helix-turn-helix (wHTH) protein
VSINGEVVMDIRRPEFSAAQLPQLDQHSLAGTSVVCFEDHWAIDVAVPHMLPNVDDPEEDGTLRMLQFGIGATELAAANQQTTKKVTLISLTAWVFVSVLLVGLCILVRSKQRFAATQAPAIPDGSRRSAAGDLVLLHDELRFRVGEAEIGLTPKQAVLLELLMRQPGRAFSDADILCHVWCDSPYANSSDVKQQIYLIRKRLRSAGLDAAAILATVPGVGYKLVITTDDGIVDAPSTDQPHS